LANTVYCPDRPRQKSDGTFVGGTPKSWNQIMSLNSDPAVVSSVKQQLQSLAFAYSRETRSIVSGLSEHPLLVEKRWNKQDKKNKPNFITHAVSAMNQSVGVDVEACGIMLAPKHNVLSQAMTNRSGEPVLEVDGPEIRLSRRPTSNSSGKVVPN